MSWLEFIVAMTVAILGGSGVASFKEKAEQDQRPAVRPEQISEANASAARDDETQKLRDRLDEFWEMHVELREEVQVLRAQVQALTDERDAANAAVHLAKDETRIVHAHVLELLEVIDHDPPWPPNYPTHLPKE